MKRGSPGLAGLIGVVFVIGLVVLVVKWVLISAAILAVPFGAWWIYDRAAVRNRQQAAGRRAATAARRRVELEGRAVVDAAGGCGWCGSRIAHLDHGGRPVLPLDWHRGEVEEVLESEGFGRSLSGL